MLKLFGYFVSYRPATSLHATALNVAVAADPGVPILVAVSGQEAGATKTGGKPVLAPSLSPVARTADLGLPVWASSPCLEAAAAANVTCTS